MMKKDYPDEGELVVGTVVKVQNFGAFVALDEYPGREGFIHIAEIATGWVKRIRNHVRERQKIVCKVLNVDKSKNHIDLSLKKVNEHQKREKIQEWKNSQKSEKLMEMLSKKLGKTVEQCYKEFGNDLIKKYGTLYAAFEEAAYDPETLKRDGFKGDWLKEFEKIAAENITIKFVEIKGYLTVNSWLPDGVNHIRNALREAEKSDFEDVDITIKYIGAPKYLISVRAPDYKIAEDQMKKAAERAKEYLKDFKGECELHRKTEE
ncbi:MAG: translation initiation factor IF-2 subunit alpha [Candidatus Thermoplasmatota archaeon]|jgi:translation initiation factor 2 subunit 1|nr:translation initiation factor IF-2 subunit alpha [Candidatus Thermoplasmatota archaeon]